MGHPSPATQNQRPHASHERRVRRRVGRCRHARLPGGIKGQVGDVLEELPYGALGRTGEVHADCWRLLAGTVVGIDGFPGYVV